MLPIGRRVFVCTEPQDMRRGFDRLAQVVVKEMGGDPRSGDWEVAPGDGITLLNNTAATIVGVRNAP